MVAKIFGVVVLLGFSTFGLYFWYRLDKPVIIDSLPNPFIFNNGTHVSSQEDWFIRREEIKNLIMEVEYGTMPGAPEALNATLKQSENLGGGNIKNTIILTIIPDNSTPNIIINFTLWVYIPNGTGPFPTIVKVSPDGTGTQEAMSQTILNRGYIYACYNHIELDPDTQGYDVEGECQEAYPSFSWGSIAVWAWGAMRVADYILNETWVNAPDGVPNVDENVLIITGHSRRGKTALLAGALDERFTMIVPNGSGCGGASSFLIQGYLSETLADITSESRFKSWFKKDFNKFANNEENLKFDQHFLRALVAPRLILSTDATEDFWANPIGTQAIYEATIPVYEIFECEENNAIHYRSGGHGFLTQDFEVILDFADKMLFNKTISGNFYMRPYYIEFPITYEAPF